MRFITLFILALLIGKPQSVDSRSQIKVEGIDIVLALDVSGSMQHQDDQEDGRSRVEIAKDEAIRFIEKRDNDAIGLVVFAHDAVSRVPLTLDKSLLKNTVKDLQIGVINPDGTFLFTGIVTAANRLKHSKSSSKIMILLTDGEPSEGDTNPRQALDVAKKLGIKIYTIGIGSDQEEFMMHPLYGMIPKPRVNTELLEKIAQETGGQSFLAKDSEDMRRVYDTIDALEKTELEAPIFSKYYDIFMPFVWFIIYLVLLELVVSSLLWFSI